MDFCKSLGIEKKFSLLELESLCKAFTQHHFRVAIFHAIRNNRQLFNGLFEDFVELEKDSIQYYVDVLHEKAKTYPTWDRNLPRTTESHGCKPVDEYLKSRRVIPQCHGCKVVVRGLLTMTEKIHIMEAIRDYKKKKTWE